MADTPETIKINDNDKLGRSNVDISELLGSPPKSKADVSSPSQKASTDSQTPQSLKTDTVPVAIPARESVPQPQTFQPSGTEKLDPAAVTVPIGIGNSAESPVQRTQQEVASALPSDETSPRVQEIASKLASRASYPPDSLIGQRSREPQGAITFPSLNDVGYVDKDAPAQQAVRNRVLEADSSSAAPKMTLGDLAAKLKQAEPVQAATPKNLEPSAVKQNESSSITEKPVFPSSLSESIKNSAVTDAPKPTPIVAEQNARPEISAANPSAQVNAASAERLNTENSNKMLTGHISNTRDSAQDSSSPINANRPAAPLSERQTIADKSKNDSETKERLESNSVERSAKAEAGKIDTIDARTTKAESAATTSHAPDAIKSNRTETISTDRTGKTDVTGKSDKVNGTKPLDDGKGRVEVNNSNKREPLIIPGVITGRASDSAGGGRGTKADVKSGTTPDAVGKKDGGKAGRPDEKADLHGDTKIAANTSNVISGVAGRIVEGLSNIKDKLIVVGSKPPNAEGASADKNNSRVEHLDHLTQPKSLDVANGIGRDLKPLSHGGTEFVINAKNQLADLREETLSSKTGGLKQALQQIFGNRPDIAADLKANTFPGPKTVPFETTQPRAGDKLVVNQTDGIDKRTIKLDDSGHLRNQKGDKVPTGNLREELAELKTNTGRLTEEENEPVNDAEEPVIDLKNRQQIKDFTVQLGEIAKASTPVSNSEVFEGHQSSLQVDESESDDEEYDSRYLYYVKEGDTLRSIFDTEVPHEIGNTAAFEYFVKINEQTIRLASVLSADNMSLILRIGTVLKLPTPKQLAKLKIV